MAPVVLTDDEVVNHCILEAAVFFSLYSIKKSNLKRCNLNGGKEREDL